MNIEQITRSQINKGDTIIARHSAVTLGGSESISSGIANYQDKFGDWFTIDSVRLTGPYVTETRRVTL